MSRRTPGLAALALVLIAHAARADVTDPFRGVTFTEGTSAGATYHLVDVDLNQPGVSFVTTPSNGAAPGMTDFQTTRDFVAATGSQIGINANFFNLVLDPTTNAAGADLVSIAASAGDAYSPSFINTWPGINFGPDGAVTFVDGTADPAAHIAQAGTIPLYNAVAGNIWLVRAGDINPDLSDPRAFARTAIGWTPSNHLLLLTVDAVDGSGNSGLTYTQEAALMLGAGASNAVNLDGGGSSTLVFADPTARIVNNPYPDQYNPFGLGRPVGNNLGIRIAPVPEPAALALLALGGAVLGLGWRRTARAR